MVYDIKKLSNVRKQLKLNLNYFKLIHKKKIITNQLKIYSFLSEKEKSIYHTIQNKYKKIEFLGSRFLIKVLTKKIIRRYNPYLKFEISLQEIETIKNESVPILYIKGEEVSYYHISITHKDPLIFVALSKQKIGIDIEKIQPRIINLKKKFLNANENMLINNALNKFYNYYYFSFYFYHLYQTYYTCLWASKESIIKMLSSSFSKINKNITLKQIIKKNIYIKYIFLLQNSDLFDIKKRKNLQVWIYSKSWIYNNHVFNITKFKKTHI